MRKQIITDGPITFASLTPRPILLLNTDVSISMADIERLRNSIQSATNNEYIVIIAETSANIKVEIITNEILHSKTKESNQ